MINSNVTIYQQRSAIAAPLTDAEKLLRAFLAGRSANTIAAYGEDLEHFAATIGAGNKSAAMAELLDAPRARAMRCCSTIVPRWSMPGLARTRSIAVYPRYAQR